MEATTAFADLTSIDICHYMEKRHSFRYVDSYEVYEWIQLVCLIEPGTKLNQYRRYKARWILPRLWVPDKK